MIVTLYFRAWDKYKCWMANHTPALTFKIRAFYKQDGRTATLQMSHFIYFFNAYKYWVF
jgi:hypothetical protein